MEVSWQSFQMYASLVATEQILRMPQVLALLVGCTAANSYPVSFLFLWLVKRRGDKCYYLAETLI